jgi:hypothetical protein
MIMRSHSVLLLVICALIPLVGAFPARAHWIEDGVGVCTEPSGASGPVIARDLMGGAFIAWSDGRNGNADIFAQRLSVSGTALWTSGGVPVCTDPSSSSDINICSDGAGGAIVTWIDSRNGNPDIYAQRIGPNGTRRWTSNGIVICNNTSNQNYPQIVPDGAGGAIIVWEDWRSGNLDAYAQRIDATGYVWWTANGVAVCSAANNQTWVRAASDNAGGAILSWMDLRNGNYDIYAQRISGAGAAVWTAGGVAICTALLTQGNPALTGDGSGGAIITWMDQRAGLSDIYAQRISSGGTVQWTADGVAIGAMAYEQYYPYLDQDGAGGAIVAWLDNRSGDGISQVYTQRINGAGTVQWTPNGVKLSARPIYQWEARVASDGQGGAVICWEDYQNIRAQRVNAAGAAQWPTDGILISAAADAQLTPRIVPNDAGGAIITWNDNRSGNYDIYANNIEAGGQLYRPAPEIASVADIPADQGGQVYFSWDASRDESFHGDWVTHYSIWRAIDPAAAFGMLDQGRTFLTSDDGIPADLPKGALRIEQLGASTYYWQLLATQDLYYQDSYGLPLATLYDSTSAGAGYHYFQVVAQTANPMVYWASSPDSGYSVDNLAPCPPLALSGEQSFVPEGLLLVWAPNAESDLDGYRVYRGTSEGFAPGPGNMLSAVCDTALLDSGWRWNSGYWYKVSAIDIHGNESGYAVLGPDAVTGVETPRAPEGTYLSQNVPNPFNPTTRIEFGLKDAARVSLRIYDAAGRLVRVLIENDRSAGRHVEMWDGRDAGGRQLASGIYFYRLTAGRFDQTNKMVLLR